ncbi:hypothetical protein BU23DRAFT_549706 [Bimuria novae-zelandiae CBS 107.79]|uniref:Uncharacterized protein n=1 Tax=Bimuria novae-zelandiae CBS 107.79 TaxID=1447943 RepID=A0A6A5VR19_9PLEO|nr:hypothetical protein BU23DRAFT_549706 [Bimuria novae-zelandiae CBS 107.79]
MGLTLLLAHFDDSAQKRALLCSAGLVLPLGEAIGRVGCFYGGCCDGRASRKRGEEKDGFIGCNGSIPLLSASINLTLYVVVVTLLMCGVLSIEEAALLAVAFNGFVRVFANHFRKDLTRLRGLRGVSPTTLFASFQGVGAMLAFSRL